MRSWKHKNASRKYNIWKLVCLTLLSDREWWLPSIYLFDIINCLFQLQGWYRFSWSRWWITVKSKTATVLNVRKCSLFVSQWGHSSKWFFRSCNIWVKLFQNASSQGQIFHYFFIKVISIIFNSKRKMNLSYIKQITGNLHFISIKYANFIGLMDEF